MRRVWACCGGCFGSQGLGNPKRTYAAQGLPCQRRGIGTGFCPQKWQSHHRSDPSALELRGSRRDGQDRALKAGNRQEAQARAAAGRPWQPVQNRVATRPSQDFEGAASPDDLQSEDPGKGLADAMLHDGVGDLAALIDHFVLKLCRIGPGQVYLLRNDVFPAKLLGGGGDSMMGGHY